jgi:hypothetical protein
MGIVRKAVIAAGLAVSLACGVVYLERAGRPAVAPAVDPSGILAGVTPADASLIRDFYAAMADIVVRDGLQATPLCKTTFELCNRHRQALATAFANTGLAGKYAGLGDRLDAYLLKAIGDTDVPLTTESRAAASKAFAAVR